MHGDQGLLLQPEQGVADRRLAHPEALGQRRTGQMRPRRELERNDPRPQTVEDLPGDGHPPVEADRLGVGKPLVEHGDYSHV
jgi:hypothetical protein